MHVDIPTLVTLIPIAILHSIIPSHWLCFSLVGKAQGWSLQRTLLVASSAFALHAITTLLFTIAAVYAGGDIVKRIGEWSHLGGSAVIVCLGILYLTFHFVGVGHAHRHDETDATRYASGALVISLLLSPCTPIIPVVIATSGVTLAQSILTVAVIMVSSIGVMIFLVWMGYLGLSLPRLSFLDRLENLIVGIALCAIGAVGLAVG